MKHLLVIVCLFSVITPMAQMCPCEFGKDTNSKIRRNEILLTCINIHEDLINFYSEKVLYVFAPVSGITYKRHLNQLSFSADYSYTQHEYQFRLDDASDYNRNDGYGYNHDIRIGLEKTFSTSKLQYFAEVDLVYNKGIYNGVSEGFGDFRPYYIPSDHWASVSTSNTLVNQKIKGILVPVVYCVMRFFNETPISLFPYRKKCIHVFKTMVYSGDIQAIGSFQHRLIHLASTNDHNF